MLKYYRLCRLARLFLNELMEFNGVHPVVFVETFKIKSFAMPSNKTNFYLKIATCFGCLRPLSGHQHKTSDNFSSFSYYTKRFYNFIF
jgi:hypothetical protein